MNTLTVGKASVRTGALHDSQETVFQWIFSCQITLSYI